MIGIIGGYNLHTIVEDSTEKEVDTPYGKPSSKIIVGKVGGVDACVLPRHGIKHSIPPHKVNYRANIWALKKLGVDRVISVCAVGSLHKEIKPGKMVFLDQFIDFTKGRDYTFHDEGEVYHLSMPEPFCKEINSIVTEQGFRHNWKITFPPRTYVCIEGPRFNTRAESSFMKEFADVVGMTLVPEVCLAREKGMCYACLAMVTDYDSWSRETVDFELVKKNMAEYNNKIKEVLKELIVSLPDERECECRKTEKGRVV